MAHPIRLRILSLLTGAALTAAEVARELGLTHANASYHLRNLLATGTIEVAREERIHPSGKPFTSTVNELSNQLHRGAKPPRTPGTILVNATLVMFEMDPSNGETERARPAPVKTERSR